MLQLPLNIVELLRLSTGSEVEIVIQDGALLVGSGRRRSRYNLDELLANFDPRAFERTPEDEEWLNSPPVGRELI